MKKIALKLSISTLILASFSSYAFEKVFVVSPAEIENISFKEGGLTVNNVSISEKSSFMAKDLVNLSFSLSARNSTDKPIKLSIMAAGFSSNEPVWALSAEPMMSMLSANKTDSIENDVYSIPGTWKKTDKIFIKITGSEK